MILKYKSSFDFYVFFAFLSIFYWFPFVSTSVISLLKIVSLGLVILSFFVFKRYLIIKKTQFLFFSLILCWSFIYQVLSNYDFFYFNTIFLMIFFYLLGSTVSYRLEKYNSIYVYILILVFTWIFLSYFIPQLNFRNNLLLDYEYAEVMLSSSGFGLGRTGWGIAVLFVTLFFMSFTKSNGLKGIIFLMAFLNVCTTGSRGAMFYFGFSFFVFIIFFVKDFRKRLLLLLSLSLLFYLLLDNFGEVLRLENSEDFFNGRLVQYDIIYKLVTENIFMGTYPIGGYSLEEQDVSFAYKEIHNAWLNFLIKYGIFGIFPLIAFLMYGLSKAFKNRTVDDRNIYIYIIIYSGLFSTLLEPGTIFSYGYHVLIFWFCLGFLSKNNRVA